MVRSMIDNAAALRNEYRECLPFTPNTVSPEIGYGSYWDHLAEQPARLSFGIAVCEKMLHNGDTWWVYRIGPFRSSGGGAGNHPMDGTGVETGSSGVSGNDTNKILFNVTLRHMDAYLRPSHQPRDNDVYMNAVAAAAVDHSTNETIATPPLFLHHHYIDDPSGWKWFQRHLCLPSMYGYFDATFVCNKGDYSGMGTEFRAGLVQTLPPTVTLYAEYNDLRPHESNVLTFYHQLAFRVTTGRPTQVISSHMLYNPVGEVRNNQLVPVHRDSFTIYDGRMPFAGRTVRIHLHAHMYALQSSLIFTGSFDTLRVGPFAPAMWYQTLHVRRDKSCGYPIYFPEDSGYANNAAIKRHIEHTGQGMLLCTAETGVEKVGNLTVERCAKRRNCVDDWSFARDAAFTVFAFNGPGPFGFAKSTHYVGQHAVWLLYYVPSNLSNNTPSHTCSPYTETGQRGFFQAKPGASLATTCSHYADVRRTDGVMLSPHALVWLGLVLTFLLGHKLHVPPAGSSLF